MEKSYILNFNGYWRELGIGGLPAQSGIYGVYAATYNAAQDTVTLNRLIYIGESEDVRARVGGHEKWPLWKRQLRSGEEVCFNVALISGDADRQRAEATMIFEHKPVCNEEYVHSFPFDKTTVTTGGRNVLMTAFFTVYPTSRLEGYGLLSGIR